MLDKVRIRNFKSIDDLSIDLGRFNVFIGENGCGKSNILESIVFASSAFQGKIDNELFAFRGARLSEARLMRSGFHEASLSQDIFIDLSISNHQLFLSFKNDNTPFSKWKFFISPNQEFSKEIDISADKNALERLQKMISELSVKVQDLKELPENSSMSEESKSQYEKLNSELVEFMERLSKEQQLTKWRIALKDNYFSKVNTIEFQLLEELDKMADMSNYTIFAPENFFLRNFSQDENYIDPLGYRGEGLLNLLKVIKKEKPEQYNSIIENLSLIDWFSSFEIKEDSSFGETEYLIADKYIEEGLKSFDLRNANEGFLFLLFYITLFTSDYTPSFFAIDNIDTALNPKLCSKLISVLSKLAVKNNKQVIITTHNPSVLDGLNLNNDEERLFVVSRNAIGNTRVKRIEKKSPLEGEQPVKLSEQFLRGYIGGLPKNF